MAERDEPPPGLGAEPVALQESPRVIDDPELPHASHGKSGIAWLDLSLAIAVLALSAASLLTAQHSGRTMEKLVEENSRLVRANSTPVLQFLSGNVGDNGRAISLSVANVGTGTARVIWFEITMMGLAKTDPIDLIDYAPRAEEQDYLPTRPVGGTYFPAGETRAIPDLELSEERGEPSKVERLRRRPLGAQGHGLLLLGARRMLDLSPRCRRSGASAAVLGQGSSQFRGIAPCASICRLPSERSAVAGPDHEMSVLRTSNCASPNVWPCIRLSACATCSIAGSMRKLWGAYLFSLGVIRGH